MTEASELLSLLRRILSTDPDEVEAALAEAATLLEAEEKGDHDG